MRISESDSIHEYLVEEARWDNRILHLIYALMIFFGLMLTSILCTQFSDDSDRVRRISTEQPRTKEEEDEAAGERMKLLQIKPAA
jgi:hypothetical protein